jgi:hypothetical protein
MIAESRVLAVGEEPPPMEPMLKRPAGTRPAKPNNAKRQADKQAAGERFRVLNNFLDFSLAELSRAEIAVWLILYRDTRDGTASTGMADIARRAGCARRNVVRAVQKLEKRGLIQVVHRGGFRRGASRYRVKPLVT